MSYQRRQNGLYWVQGVNEADDSPRNELMYYSASATSYQGLAALYLSRIAQVLGRADLKSFFDQQHEEIKALVNARFWDASHHIYNDLTRDGKFITELEPGILCKHVHMFWPLMAELTPPERLAGIIAELKTPASFNRSSGIPSLSADSKGYNAENGQYWKGAVWPSAQCMVQEGLRACGQQEFLQETAEKYYQACLKAYQDQGTIMENLAPDKPMGFGARDFVGWGGIGPVANLIEHILGFDLNAPANTITWRINRLERHGLQNLQFGGFETDLICEARSSPGNTCHITVKSGGSFVLKVLGGGQAVEKEIHPGTQSFDIPANKSEKK
jgi:glycogen debranching enzyme